ncbi:ABC transporter type 1, transmembrane domain-containing protein [Sordaria brevicollis]|uniref:ABC transporter type 1, transmembrane domain-containing protein n=1 Tax=Sordaria brevicollis TaxID=83679 RepID=A0AAE0NWI1_SORBR|nr:ABC transporter type 1, transmembrane domain-containing protein [Sordaria brevicollis]
MLKMAALTEAKELESILWYARYAISALFIALLPWRLYQLQQRPVETRTNWRQYLKLIITTFFLGQQVVTAYLFFSAATIARPPALVSLLPVASIALVILSQFEHRKSIKPSGLILLYLLSSAFFDLFQLTIPSLRNAGGFNGLFAIGLQLAAKIVVVNVECLGKASILIDEEGSGHDSLEEKASILSRAFVSWIGPVLKEGYRMVLVTEKLPSVDHKLASGSLRASILRTLSEYSSSPFALVLLRGLHAPFLTVIVPRLFVICFRYSQPALIRYTIEYVQSPETDEDRGYLIVFVAAIIYIGLALSTRAYQHGLNRLQVMIRGALLGLVHEHSLLARHEPYSSGTTVAMATTDIGALEGAPRMLHESWALSVEVVIGSVFLAKQVGWLWPVPHVIIIVCSQVSRYVARNLKSSQATWNKATQARISATSTALGSVKTIKMTGLQGVVEKYILGLREEELDKANRVRWITAVYNASANTLGMFTPVITIVLFAIIAMASGTTLDTKTAFPTIAVLALVTHSANMVMTIIPQAIAAYASFDRIEEYTKSPKLPTISRSPRPQQLEEGVEVSIRELTVEWAPEDNGTPTLENINIELSRGQVVACLGPVGAGKSTLARAILGEVPLVKGTVRYRTERIAYYSQKPWLPNKTIKQVICGAMASYVGGGDEWYQTVIRACCLDQDLDALPDGDETVVGVDGMNLSGGQRQRALARAVYHRCKMVVLDDPFSALDGRTRDQVAQNLLGPEGLVRKLNAAVFWITSSTKNVDLSDHVVILGNRIVAQGTWEELRKKDQRITEYVDYDVSKSVNKEDKNPATVNKKTQTSPMSSGDDLKRSQGDLSLYRYYFSNAGLLNILLMVACTASYSFFLTFPQYWVNWWTQDAELDDSANKRGTLFYALGYSLLYLMAWISTNGTMLSTVFRVAPTSGLALHQTLLRTIMHAPLLWFSMTDSGVLLNYFSQDIQLVDKTLAQAVMAFSNQVFKMIVQVALLYAAQPFMAISLPICAIVVYVIQKVYLRTSRQLRLLELESRSAVNSSLMETVQGIETIRAFGFRIEAAMENTRVVDISQRPSYLLLCLQRWLNVVLDLLVAGVAVATILLAVELKGTVTGGQIGVALSVIIAANATLLSLVYSWTNLEVSLGAISRLKSVEEDTPKEPVVTSSSLYYSFLPRPFTGWPSLLRSYQPRMGFLVRLEEVSASYTADGPLVLQGISLDIRYGQVVVICGRTGSGKSSLLLTMLRLIPIRDGSIKIEYRDIREAPLDIIREKALITVTQDPFFLPEASLRFNLDPTCLLSDEDLISVLQMLDLWSHLSSSSSTTSNISQNPENQPGPMNETTTLSVPKSTTTSYTEPTTTQSSSQPLQHSTLDTPLSSLPTLSTGNLHLLSLSRAIIKARHMRRQAHLAIEGERQQEMDPGFITSLSCAPGWRNPDIVQPIILLDEITASLDEETQRKVLEVVRKEFVGKEYTVVMVTHQVEGVREVLMKERKGDLVVSMEGGRVSGVEMVEMVGEEEGRR